MVNNKAVVFKKWAVDYPVIGEHFEYVTDREITHELKDGEILTRNLYVSMDPYLRAKMRSHEETNLFGRFNLGQVIDNHAIAEVIASKNPNIPVGEIVYSFLGWEEYSVIPAGQYVEIIKNARESKLPLSARIG
ncbi:hypothetical protein BGZ99_000126, partial [Dissophora globulifera]